MGTPVRLGALPVGPQSRESKSVRWLPSEIEKYARAAFTAGMTFSEFIRMIASNGYRMHVVGFVPEARSGHAAYDETSDTRTTAPDAVRESVARRPLARAGGAR